MLIRKENTMNYDIITVLGFGIGLVLTMFAAVIILRFRHAFLVPEGCARLLYLPRENVKGGSAKRRAEGGAT
jgi:hypothetical protein